VWGYVMSMSCGSTGHVDNVEDLKHKITAAVASSTPEMSNYTWSVIKSWLSIVCVCAQTNHRACGK
jgi:hypothetical protein